MTRRTSPRRGRRSPIFAAWLAALARGPVCARGGNGGEHPKRSCRKDRERRCGPSQNAAHQFGEPGRHITCPRFARRTELELRRDEPHDDIDHSGVAQCQEAFAK